MEPLSPIAGLTIDQYADLSAEIAVSRGDPLKVGQALGRAGVAAPAWEQAHAGWSARLVDPSLGGAIVDEFEKAYHAALDRLMGPPPDVPPEDFVTMLGEALMWGLPTMVQRRGIDSVVWSRISYRARAALLAEPARMAGCLSLAGQIAERRLSGAVPTPPGKSFEQDASVAAKAVGKAVVSGLGAFGSALDDMGKSLFGPGVGKPVVVQWSDGKQYPGTVAQVGKGQYLVTMADGSQRWVPEAYVKAV